MARGEFHFTEETDEGVKIFNLSGKIMGGPETQLMCGRIKSLIDEGQTAFVMNFRQVKWINSNGIGAILSCLISLRTRGGDLRFTGLHHAAKKYFLITKLDTVLQIYPSVTEAVKSFQTMPAQSSS